MCINIYEGLQQQGEIITALHAWISISIRASSKTTTSSCIHVSMWGLISETGERLKGILESDIVLYTWIRTSNEEQQKWKTFQHLDAEFLYWYSSKVKHMVIRDDKSEQEGDFQGLQW